MDEDLHFADLTEEQRIQALLLLIFGKATELDRLTYASEEQKKSVEKMWRKLQVGMKGYPKFGGERSTITEAVQFTQNDDGTIGYRVVGERKIKNKLGMLKGQSPFSVFLVTFCTSKK